jgi:hypothetical protein
MHQDHIILGIHIHNRMKEAPSVQALLGEFGCHIRTRLGLHETSESFCSGAGVILLDLIGDRSQINQLESKLLAVPGVAVQKMVFGHD